MIKKTEAQTENVVLGDDDLREAAAATIKKSGLTLVELRGHAVRDSFPTLRARAAWASLQPLVARHII